MIMIEDIRKEHELVDLFCNLAEVPSPSMHEEKVAEWIKNYCDKNEIDCKLDDFKNIVINIPATGTLIAPRFRKIVCFILLILYLIYCVNTIVKIHATYEGWEFMEWLSYSLTNIVAAIAGYMICKDQINNVL